MKFITIYITNLPQDLYILKSKLESEELRCYVKDDYILNIDPLLSPIIGGAKLQVHPDDFLKACQIMEEVKMKIYLEDDQLSYKDLINHENEKSNIWISKKIIYTIGIGLLISTLMLVLIYKMAWYKY